MSETNPIEVTVSPEEQETALRIQQDVERGLEFLNSGQHDAAISAFKGALQAAPERSPVRDIVTHNLLTAYKARINQLLTNNEPVHVNRYIPEVQALTLTSPLVNDKAFRTKFADQLRNLSLDFYNAAQFEAALFFIRRALVFDQCPSYYIDLTNALARVKTRAQLRDYTTQFSEADLGRHVFITCAPKSGSTFLKNLLVSITGFKFMFAVYASLQNEQELDLPHLIKFGNVNTVTQQHARASEANIQMMQAFGIRPTVLVRNIFDTTASLLDFYTNGFVFSTYFDKEEFLSFDDDQKIDLLIEYVLPWYFQFVASWQRAEKEGRLEVNWITYEDMVADKAAMVARVLSFYGIDAPATLIDQKLTEIESDREKNRFNKGGTGRGKLVLNDEQRDRITRLSRHFPSTDFSCLGL
ncbi:MAG: sulfotransferase domain-containing protein [Pyrinomonadaceae bacterium]